MKNLPKFLRILAFALILAFSLSILGACSPTEDGASRESDTESEMVSPSDTDNVADENSAPSDNKPDENNPADKAIARKDVTYKDLGIRGKALESADPQIATGVFMNSYIRIFAYSGGSTTLTVTDYFGFTAKIQVSVDADEKKVTCTPIPCKEDFIEVGIDFGAKGNGANDDTAAFQKALDAAKPGETVYVYPGRYNVSLLTMPEGVTLKMYTTMTDAKEGFQGQIAKDFRNNKIAILSGTRILNCKNGTPGRDANSNFKIIGGAIDLNLQDRSTLIFGKADNVTVENVIFKDIKNNHIIQLTGSTNVTVKNCMFAGFVCGSQFTRCADKVSK